MTDGTTTSVNIDQYLNDLKANAKLLTVTLPATASKQGNTGITLTYQAIDGLASLMPLVILPSLCVIPLLMWIVARYQIIWPI